METLKQINCKFETSLAYYEMCAEDAMFDYYTESEGDPAKDAAATKSVWTKIKEIVIKIFKSLTEALRKIGSKIASMFGSNSAQDDLKLIKDAVSKMDSKSKNRTVEISDVNGSLKDNAEFQKDLEKMMLDIKSGKDLSKDDVIEARNKWRAKKNKNIKKTVVIGSAITIIAAGLAFAAKMGFKIDKLKTGKPDPANTSDDKTEPINAHDEPEPTNTPDNKPRILPREAFIKPNNAQAGEIDSFAYAICSSKVTKQLLNSCSGNSTANADVIPIIASASAEVQKDTALNVAKLCAGTSKIKSQIIKNPYENSSGQGPSRVTRAGHVNYLSSSTNKLTFDTLSNDREKLDKKIDENKSLSQDSKQFMKDAYDNMRDRAKHNLDRSAAGAERAVPILKNRLKK